MKVIRYEGGEYVSLTDFCKAVGLNVTSTGRRVTDLGIPFERLKGQSRFIRVVDLPRLIGSYQRLSKSVSQSRLDEIFDRLGLEKINLPNQSKKEDVKKVKKEVKKVIKGEVQRVEVKVDFGEKIRNVLQSSGFMFIVLFVLISVESFYHAGLIDHLLKHYGWWESIGTSSMLMMAVLIFTVNIKNEQSTGLIFFGIYNWIMTSSAFFNDDWPKTGIGWVVKLVVPLAIAVAIYVYANLLNMKKPKR